MTAKLEHPSLHILLVRTAYDTLYDGTISIPQRL